MPIITLSKKEEVCDDLTIFKFRSDKFDFKPGQWITLSIEIDGKKVLRPYSIASSPDELPDLELFIKLVRKKEGNGTFTSKLFEAKEGDKFEFVKIGGTFILDETDKRKKILLSSGTGLAPYISMVRYEIKKYGKSKSIIVHGASYTKDLAYKEELEKYEKEGKIIKYIPTISRPDENKAWKGSTGRVESLIESNKLASILKEEITKEKYVIYACGHPNMIDFVVELLQKKCFIEHKDIKFERYWSVPKKTSQIVSL